MRGTTVSVYNISYNAQSWKVGIVMVTIVNKVGFSAVLPVTQLLMAEQGLNPPLFTNPLVSVVSTHPQSNKWVRLISVFQNMTPGFGESEHWLMVRWELCFKGFIFSTSWPEIFQTKPHAFIGTLKMVIYIKFALKLSQEGLALRQRSCLFLWING